MAACLMSALLFTFQIEASRHLEKNYHFSIFDYVILRLYGEA
jgi:predicted nucleic acid-binding protein